jgi:hypothetical protein
MGLFKKGKKFRKNYKPSYGNGDEPRETYKPTYGIGDEQRETYKPSYSTDKKLRRKKEKMNENLLIFEI